MPIFFGLFLPVILSVFSAIVHTLLFYTLRFFHTSVNFHLNLSDSKFHQISRTLLSILTDLNIFVVWMIPIRPPISNSSSPLSILLVTVPSAPITIGITVTFMFNSFVLLQSLSIRFLWFPLCGRLGRQNSLYSKFSFSFLFFFFFSVIMWLIVSPHSPYNLNLLSYCVLNFNFSIIGPYGVV